MQRLSELTVWSNQNISGLVKALQKTGSFPSLERMTIFVGDHFKLDERDVEAVKSAIHAADKGHLFKFDIRSQVDA